MKTPSDRIRYYARKAREFSENRRNWPHRFNRFNRLVAYKAAMTATLRKETRDE